MKLRIGDLKTAVQEMPEKVAQLPYQTATYRKISPRSSRCSVRLMELA